MEIQGKKATPEELLALAEREESFARQGHLKIFLGMAAGVGKTYAMLEEAHQIKEEGRDPIIGIVYTHGRQETALLLEGLKKIPEKKIEYKGREYLELDLDAVLELKPDLVLIDELAHTNIPGLRHEKRWQDVREILENGIDVYTTLNVQHIESLKDIVEGIVGVSVRETVPDLIVEKASALRLVDISPDELLQRLREGKVYLGDQSKIAVEHFFQKDRLTALREIVLRYAAEKVHLDLSQLPPITETRIDWKPREKFLVAVSPSPHSQKLIRTARRLSSNVNAPWVALYVERGVSLNEEEAHQLDKNLILAENLGAEVITVNNPNLLEGIKLTAREKGVTQIIIGRPPKVPFFGWFTHSTIIDQLAAECTDIDIHVIRQDRYNVQFRRRLFSLKPFSTMRDYVYTLVFAGFLSSFNVLILPYLGYKAVGFIFLLGILLLSLYMKKGPILFASLLFGIIWVYFFIPPVNTLDNEDLILLGLYLLSAIIIGILLERTRLHKDLLIKSQKTSEALFEIVKTMASNENIALVLEFIKKKLSHLLDGTIDLVIKWNEEENISEKTSPLLINEKERNAFLWAFANGNEAGWATDTLPTCQNYYLPLMSQTDPHGLLIYKPNNTHLSLNPEEKKFLYTVCRQIGAFIERIQAEEKNKENEQLHQIERMHGILLERFQLLFEKPIEKAKTAIFSLKDKRLPKDPRIEEIENSLDIVTKTFSNVSAMSQLIEGLVPLVKEKYKVEEVVKECCESIKKSYPKSNIEFYHEGEIPPISLDYYLIKILIYNILIFCIESSKRESKVLVRLKGLEKSLVLSFLSEENTMSTERLLQFFEKFHYTKAMHSPNTDMGLVLAKTIAEVHGGVLKAESIRGNGILFTFSISLDQK